MSWKGRECMPIPKDKTMLQVDSKKILIAMAENMLEPAELANRAEVPKNIVYAIRRGNYVKPKYIGKVALALGVKVTDLLPDEPEKALIPEE